MRSRPIPSPIYDIYWHFAVERQNVYFRRLQNQSGPWTDDPILGAFRFTNVYRASDRVSQFLLREVQYGKGRSQAPDEVFFRTILFKIFNRIDTWETIENELGQISWQSWKEFEAARVLNNIMEKGGRIYSAAYIMPSPSFGHKRKHSNHLALLSMMMAEGLPAKLLRAGSLADVYNHMLQYAGIGQFLAFQYAIDLNYSSFVDFDESEFVVAGPGALDGIAKCFVDTADFTASEIIHMMVDQQEAEFERLGLKFNNLFGRRLQPIDCQNIFCEISKYTRVSHPEAVGLTGRTRIKQRYASKANAVYEPFFPPKWNLKVTLPVALIRAGGQLSLYS